MGRKENWESRNCCSHCGSTACCCGSKSSDEKERMDELNRKRDREDDEPKEDNRGY